MRKHEKLLCFHVIYIETVVQYVFAHKIKRPSKTSIMKKHKQGLVYPAQRDTETLSWSQAWGRGLVMLNLKRKHGSVLKWAHHPQEEP